MKKINFRIIELPTYQVLLSKDFDEDDESPVLSMTVIVDGISISQNHSYSDEATRDNVFDTFSDESAQLVVNGIINLLSNPQLTNR